MIPIPNWDGRARSRVGRSRDPRGSLVASLTTLLRALSLMEGAGVVNSRMESGDVESDTQGFDRELMSELLKKLGRGDLLEMLELVTAALRQQG